MRGIFIAYISFIVLLVGSWVVNLKQFLSCDFDPVNKQEIVKGIGVFIPPAAIITVWVK